MERKRERRDELAPKTPVRNLRLLPCATALDTGTPEELRQAVIGELHDLDSEVVVVDVGSSNRDDLFDFFAEQAFRVLVTSRAPASRSSRPCAPESALSSPLPRPKSAKLARAMTELSVAHNPYRSVPR